MILFIFIYLFKKKTFLHDYMTECSPHLYKGFERITWLNHRMQPVPLQRTWKDYMIILQNAAHTSTKGLKGLHDYTTKCSLHLYKKPERITWLYYRMQPAPYKGPERITWLYHRMYSTPLQRAWKDYMILPQNIVCISKKGLKGLHDYTIECGPRHYKGTEKIT